MSKQNAVPDNEKKEKKKDDVDDHVQEKLETQAAQKLNKANENLILMTQNYNKYYYENHCEHCSTISLPSKILNNAKTNWMSSEKLNDLRRKAHEAVRMHKVFILKGFFHTVRKALIERGWVCYFDMEEVKRERTHRELNTLIG
jgi:hypothetical protein